MVTRATGSHPSYNAKAGTANLFVDQELKSFTASMLAEDLEALADLMAAGDMKTVIDRHYPLRETAGGDVPL